MTDTASYNAAPLEEFDFPDWLDIIVVQWAAVRPDLDASSMALFGRMARLRGHLEREILKTHAADGLPAGGFDVLATLRRTSRAEGMNANDLLAQMMITSGTLTHRMDLLEKAGWLERKRNPYDGRGILVHLTEAGTALIDKAVEHHLETQKRLATALSDEDKATLNRLLKRWLGSFEDETE